MVLDPDHDWRRAFNLLRFSTVDPHSSPGTASRPETRAWYRLGVGTRELRMLVVEVYQQRRKVGGDWGRITSYPLPFVSAEGFAGAEDRELVGFLTATASSLREHMRLARRYATLPPANHRSFVPNAALASVLPRLCATGRFFRSPRHPDKGGVEALRFDPGPAWTFAIRIERIREERDPDPDDSTLPRERVRLTGVLRRGDDRRPVAEPELVLDGAVLFGDVFARLEARDLFPWIWLLRSQEEITASESQLDALLDELFNLPVLPSVEMPPEWPLSEVALEPGCRLVVRAPRPYAAPVGPPADEPLLPAEVFFDYDGLAVAIYDRRRFLVDRARRRVVRRAPDAEEDAAGQLLELGAEMVEPRRPGCDFEIATSRFAGLVLALVQGGWRVEAEGRRLRPPGEVRLSVSSGVDWLEVRGRAEFGDPGVAATGLLLPELLLAIERGERLVRLGDGTSGILPDEWLERYGPLASLGEEAGDAWRFPPSQAFLLDLLLDAESQVDADRAFARLRDRLRSFEGVEPAREPRGFRGELRPYQHEGLGWLRFLRAVGFGGCLADDMGLGKTVQVLALLAGRPRRSGEGRPALVVVPRSLVHNWLTEAARFTPNLRAVRYTGPGRGELLAELAGCDLAVTTYGTLRHDVETLVQVPFDTLILDEAQAIKNPASQTARACRRLDARHRLALTGTPVENHLGELASILSFLNPGMLERVPGFAEALDQRTPDAETLALVARALRPFILRRTKEAVLADLPAKTEQVLTCELRERQRRQYDELRDHYRRRLAARVEEVGLQRSKLEVIEALLRLRQAACHSGLIDPAHAHERSAKLDVLLRQLREVLAEGHKALVFSQFTRFLDLVRRRLDRVGTPYEYLDGRTRDRRRRVERFQNDDGCPLFLISLKAGGVGLNLTAADYVFLLDPWWNPAVEAQAVDRAHRIGQERPVFVYRLIARDTIEEKILDLQARKRSLADAILTADQGLIRDLTGEDLRWLLS